MKYLITPQIVADDGQNASIAGFPIHEALCEEIVLALMSGRRFLSLGGDAGSGKSLCCQIIMERLPPDWIPVYLNRPANSYEELLRQACIDLGTTGDSRRPGFSWPDEFNRQVLARQADLHKVLLILDQGEQLFSAILERLLDRCRHTGDLVPEFALLLVCLNKAPSTRFWMTSDSQNDVLCNSFINFYARVCLPSIKCQCHTQ